MTPHRKYSAIVSGVQRTLIEPLQFLAIRRGPTGCVAVPGVVEDDFGTAQDTRRALSTDRRHVSTNDDRGHIGRAA